MAAGQSQRRETPESILIRHEENSMIYTLIEGLPHLFREVLVLRDVEDMFYRKIAYVTGATARTVMPRLGGARAMPAAARDGAQAKPSKDMLP
jgi:RNA polymerase sigma-70 factor (ECF subfamily)